MEKNKQYMLKFLHIISLLAFLYGAYSIMKNGFLPAKYRTIVIIGALVLYTIIGLLLHFRKNSALGKAIMALILLVLGGVSVVGAQTLNKGVETIDKLNENEKKQTVAFSLLVLKDSKLEKTEEIKDKSVLTALTKDKSNLDAFVKMFKEEKKFDIKLTDGDNYNLVAQKLLKKEAEVILLNESFRSIIEEAEGLEDFTSKTRAIERFNVDMTIDPEDEEKMAQEAKAEIEELTKLAEKKYDKKKDGKQEKLNGFTVYVSGIDSYGGISTSGRSDVNIIMSVNPKTRKVITATIPRDSYVPIAGGGNNQYDKLTHAGIYGVDSSRQTLQNLFEIPLHYYARVNFTSLINMVDVLGGINVNNPVSFSSRGFDFPAGNINLSGESALAFSRERYSLASGDFDRGRNQMRVIEGMVRKAMTPSNLLNYNRILNVVMESAQTNMPSSEIIKLINNQIDKGGEWTFEAYSVEGYGQMGLPSYAMPGWNLYMFVPNMASVDRIAEVLYMNMK